ncbi:MAG: TIGR03960 family B12-binding radical SAM protein [Ruminococcaceae bacterium]|nr:TIGR03960 family B12-binding radical SAM protein [Oscillospiraceae bacterium]
MQKNISTILKSVQKPGRYTGGEFGQIVKDKSKTKMRIAFCFPDTYEIGMSNLGMKILYGALNQMEDVWCERVFAPWTDMEEQMRKNNVPLFALESKDNVKDFDIMAISLQYELCYTTAVNMIDLAGLPIYAKDRGEDTPVILGGGPCAYNAEPVADFFDIFSIGEGEEALCELSQLYLDMKSNGTYTKSAFLREASHLKGFYVPSLYNVEYNADGTIKLFEPKFEDVPETVEKRVVEDLNTSYFPLKPVMPYIETVHDRIMLETFRGCIRGCRFCQAGMVFRPVREKSAEVLNAQAQEIYKNTGYNEISLTSLSISDYSCLNEATDLLLDWTNRSKVNLSLPSLRADSFTKELMRKVSGVRSSGLTFAPEAGTQRLRDAINKNLYEEDLLNAVRLAFEGGKSQVKLYFMNGLPTETYEDIEGISVLAKHVVDEFYKMHVRPKKPVQVTVSVSCFVPKPHTPFQWEPQDTLDSLIDKQKFLGEKITDRKVRYNWHEAKVSRLEAVFSKGDRRLSKAIATAVGKGMHFDAWDEYFDYDKWMSVFEECGIDPSFYANRKIGFDEILPWDVIDIGVNKSFLISENKKAYESKTTPNCKEKCSGCGANKLGKELTWCPKKK